MAIWIEAKLVSADESGAAYVYRTSLSDDYTGEVWINRDVTEFEQKRPATGERGTFACERVVIAVLRDRRRAPGTFPPLTNYCA